MSQKYAEPGNTDVGAAGFGRCPRTFETHFIPELGRELDDSAIVVVLFGGQLVVFEGQFEVVPVLQDPRDGDLHGAEHVPSLGVTYLT